MGEWPRNWPDLIRGIGCEMCEAGRPDADRYGIRVLEGTEMAMNIVRLLDFHWDKLLQSHV